MILADTQAAAWLTLDFDKLSPKAKTAIREERRKHYSIAIASTTLWELAMMVTRQQIAPDVPLLEYLQTIEERFTVLPIDARVAERSMQFSEKFPKDPADRIIGATALVYGLSLVTSDKTIRKSGEVPCIW